MPIKDERLAARQAELFSALAHPKRLVIIDCLLRHEMSVSELERCDRLVPISQPSVSQHLVVLRQAGLVQRRRRGRRVLYQAVGPELGPLLGSSEILIRERIRNLL